MALNGDVRPLELENAEELRIQVREQGTTIAIEMAGELDLAALDVAGHAIDRALADGRECVLLDLSRLEFIDSSGLHVTLELARRSAAQNVRLVIIPGPRAVQRVFEITGLVDRLPFIDEQPTGSQTKSSRAARDAAAGSGTISLPAGDGRRANAAVAGPHSVAPASVKP